MSHTGFQLKCALTAKSCCIQVHEWHSPSQYLWELIPCYLPVCHLQSSTQSHLCTPVSTKETTKNIFESEHFPVLHPACGTACPLLWENIVRRKLLRHTCSQRIRFAQTVHHWLFFFFFLFLKHSEHAVTAWIYPRCTNYHYHHHHHPRITRGVVSVTASAHPELIDTFELIQVLLGPTIMQTIDFTGQFNTFFFLPSYHAYPWIVACTVFSHVKGGKCADQNGVLHGSAAEGRVVSVWKQGYRDTTLLFPNLKHYVVKCEIVRQYGRTRCLCAI